MWNNLPECHCRWVTLSHFDYNATTHCYESTMHRSHQNVDDDDFTDWQTDRLIEHLGRLTTSVTIALSKQAMDELAIPGHWSNSNIIPWYMLLDSETACRAYRSRSQELPFQPLRWPKRYDGRTQQWTLMVSQQNNSWIVKLLI